VGTAALGCPVERSSTRFSLELDAAELRSAGQPRAAVPTWPRMIMLTWLAPARNSASHGWGERNEDSPEMD